LSNCANLGFPSGTGHGRRMMNIVGPLVLRTTGEVVLEHLQIADGFWSRFLGLQFRKSLPERTGLLLVPCPSIHTFFMRFPIDVVTLDREARIMEVRSHLKPWKVFVPKQKPWAILEFPVGTAQVERGSQLGIFEEQTAHQRKHLQFLQFNCNNRDESGVRPPH
ncbi:MAG: DUF192 domain-containing protein, partial [Planctomycetaceae bacterium]|nr:DUF192 domain-containing protein [Planctomycetaceae bacterium]